ncbi:MAG TPA: ChbG/HpnK family deacetylase [Acidobacteriaceae bacterium]|jgi:predicted glycoside hydrolase/deacetylase ChbG (UPF0249 family)|nr:ChbG/HpnK family deacetylase [Acidobacteriaceae bacterium]
MPARLIVNADDFGLTPGINRAIAELHDAGAVTSATLMATGPAFDDALALARSRPSLGVGCHIVLTDGVPVSDPASIPSLLGPDRRSFRPSLAAFALAVARGRVNPDEIAREVFAQIQKLQRAGIDVTHVDTHKHTHILPSVARPILRVLEGTSIASIRNPFEPRWSAALGHSTRRIALVRAFDPLRRRFDALPSIAQHKILTTDGTLGVSATGDLNSNSLGKILASIPHGLWELVCHPGYNDRDLDAVTTRLRSHREVELHALLAAFAPVSSHPRPLERIHYGSLGADGAHREKGTFFPDTGYEHLL